MAKMRVESANYKLGRKIIERHVFLVGKYNGSTTLKYRQALFFAKLSII